MPGHNMAGIIGNMMKKREEADRLRHEKEVAILPHHTCQRPILPFSTFPSGKLMSYTATDRIMEDSDDPDDLGDSLTTYSGDEDDTDLDSLHKDESLEMEPLPIKREGPDNAVLYCGLIISSLGLIFCFTGLKDVERGTGFKTLPLQLVGPLLFCVGLVVVIVKFIQCACPCFNREANSVVDQTTLVEKGMANGHLKGPSGYSTPQIVSPRVTLQSLKAPPRPQSIIPNYVEDSSDDDFYYAPAIKTQPIKSPSRHKIQGNKNEIVLTPKELNW